MACAGASESNTNKIIDFVLVSNVDDGLENERRIFEEGLEKVGLILVHCQLQIDNDHLQFTFIHAPLEVLLKYYEIFNFYMPLKRRSTASSEERKFNIFGENFRRKWKHTLFNKITRISKNIYHYFIQEDVNFSEERPLFYIYRQEKSYLFDLEHECFNNSTARITVVFHLLNYQSWSVDVAPENVTLEQILQNKIYLAAYPPHEGDFDEVGTPRYDLLRKWMKLSIWDADEPVDEVEKYFGGKYASYFAWLGCYARLLLIPSIFGIISLLYGICTLPIDSFSNDVCEATNITMCPTCDYKCDYYSLSNNCLNVKITHIFNNSSSVAFAFMMAMWVTVYVQIWKRRSAILKYRWGMCQLSIDQIPISAQYLAILEKHKKEKISFRERFSRIIFSYVTILFFIIVIIAATVAVAIYQMWISNVIYAVDSWSWIKNYGFLIKNFSPALLNLITIQCLDTIYPKIAIYLNYMELHRTQYEFQQALAVKIYVFRFINTYSALLYTALFKGKFIGHPGNYYRIFGVRQEECGYGGCMTELIIQLATIMTGKQIIELLTNYATPAFVFLVEKIKEAAKSSQLPTISTQCITNYQLLDYDVQGTGLFDEYLSIVIQFGFITLFIPAFSLAPLCAFIVNIIKIRLDARKLLKFYRRPIPLRFPDTDIWVQIMDSVGDLSVLTNGIILAFTSDFIPRLIYQLHNGGSDQGFLRSSLSEIKVSDLEPNSRPPNSTSNINIHTCMYENFHELPMSKDDFQWKFGLYWEILIARFIFLVLYQNIVYAVKILIKYLIPEEPSVLQKLRRVHNRRIFNLMLHTNVLDAKLQSKEKDTLMEDQKTSSKLETLQESLDVGVNRLISQN